MTRPRDDCTHKCLIQTTQIYGDISKLSACTELEQVTFVSLPSIQMLGAYAFSRTKVEKIEQRIREQAPHITNWRCWGCRERHLSTDDEVSSDHVDQDSEDDNIMTGRLLKDYELSDQDFDDCLDEGFDDDSDEFRVYWCYEPD